jgi:hypothetical protein
VEHYDTVIHTAPADPLGLRALVKKGELLARHGDGGAARAAFTGALAHPACSDAWRATIERGLAKLAPGGGAPTAR